MVDDAFCSVADGGQFFTPQAAPAVAAFNIAQLADAGALLESLLVAPPGPPAASTSVLVRGLADASPEVRAHHFSSLFALPSPGAGR